MKTEYLKELGLTKNEIKVYLTLLKIGSGLAGQITEKSGIHRRNVYDSIERLLEKGLVGYILKGKRKYFEAVHPDRFLDLIKEKEEKIKSILPELLETKELGCNKQETIIYKGEKGVKLILDDIVKSAKQNLSISTCVPEKFMYIIDQFHRLRLKNKINDKILFNRAELKRAKKLAKLSNTEIRFLPKEYAPLISVNIYADKVGIIIWHDDPVSIKIEDKKFSDSFRDYFKFMWSLGKT